VQSEVREGEWKVESKEEGGEKAPVDAGPAGAIFVLRIHRKGTNFTRGLVSKLTRDVRGNCYNEYNVSALTGLVLRADSRKESDIAGISDRSGAINEDTSPG
jgi:hypothetical protein